jgi:hypothetical protein
LASNSIFSETIERDSTEDQPLLPPPENASIAVSPRPVPGPGPGLKVATSPIRVTGVEVDQLSDGTLSLTDGLPGLADGLPGLAVAENPRVALTTALLNVDMLKSQNSTLRAEVETLKKLQRKITGEQANHEIQRLNLLIADSFRDRDAAKARATGAERELREVKTMMRRARSEKNGADDPLRRRDRFADADADSWVRHEILLAWIERLDPLDRVRYPISTDYLVGVRFVESLETLESGQLTKAFKAVVDVVSGYVSAISSRNVHPLRTGSGGADADLVRTDGARCYRAYIEHNTPAARRLHFWKHPTGQLELSRIVVHDDVQP